jgi:hypothetical protein
LHQVEPRQHYAHAPLLTLHALCFNSSFSLLNIFGRGALCRPTSLSAAGTCCCLLLGASSGLRVCPASRLCHRHPKACYSHSSDNWLGTAKQTHKGARGSRGNSHILNLHTGTRRWICQSTQGLPVTFTTSNSTQLALARPCPCCAHHPGGGGGGRSSYYCTAPSAAASETLAAAAATCSISTPSQMYAAVAAASTALHQLLLLPQAPLL